MRRILAFVLLAAFAVAATEAVSIVTAGKAAAQLMHTQQGHGGRRGR